MPNKYSLLISVWLWPLPTVGFNCTCYGLCPLMPSFILAIICFWQYSHRHTGLLPSHSQTFTHKPHYLLWSPTSDRAPQGARDQVWIDHSWVPEPRASRYLGTIYGCKCVQTFHRLSASGEWGGHVGTTPRTLFLGENEGLHAVDVCKSEGFSYWAW